VFVNNAGISHIGKRGRPLEEMVKSARTGFASIDELRAVFETNVFGVLAVTQAMLPLLREAPAARIVNVSSSVGSLALNSDPTNRYRSMSGTYAWSETALNAIAIALASDLESVDIKVNAVCPGYTATDLNNFEGTPTVQQAAREPVRLALSMRTVRRTRSRTRTARSRGDLFQPISTASLDTSATLKSEVN